MKRLGIRQWAEAIVAWTLFKLFGALPVDIASALGGWLGRTIGVRLPVTRHARRNLARVFPEMDPSAREQLVLNMWDNLGRAAAEFPHLDSMRVGPGERVEVVGMENVEAARAAGKGLIFFGAHIGNWEILGAAAAQLGIPLNLVYRAPNNRLLEGLFTARGNRGAEMIPKGSQGARRSLQVLREGRILALLVDQKMNDGIPVPFFGRDAMTAPALAQFALKFGCPIIPGHVERLKGARLRVVVDPPLTMPAIQDRHAAILAVMTEVNRIIEGWVRSNPGQWLWIHRRWPD